MVLLSLLLLHYYFCIQISELHAPGNIYNISELHVPGNIYNISEIHAPDNIYNISELHAPGNIYNISELHAPGNIYIDELSSRFSLISLVTFSIYFFLSSSSPSLYFHVLTFYNIKTMQFCPHFSLLFALFQCLHH